MRVLDIGENQLEGTLPFDLGFMLPNLNVLSIGSNRFTGSIPTSISNSSGLHEIVLYSNNFQGQVPLLHKLRRARRIQLAQNFLGNGRNTDLDFIYSLANSSMLQFLEISNNNFQGVFPEVICNFSMLTALALEANRVSGQIPTCIRNLVDLVEISTPFWHHSCEYK